MRVVVIGGGAAGMLAAVMAAKEGHETMILEKTNSLGNKLKITGKGRCNLTFEGDINQFKENLVNNFKFMYSSFTQFDNHDVIQFFEELGVKTKIERGARVFPQSDDAKEIVDVLKRELKKQQVEIKLGCSVQEILQENQQLVGVKLETGRVLHCDKCIIATGGKSYQVTGSTGDGYTLAKRLGHHIIDIKPGLVPFRSNDQVCSRLQGLSLRNVGLKIMEKEDQVIYQDFGELMFAHFGLTGPTVLSASSKLNRYKNVEEKLKQNQIYASIDLKPALDLDTLDKRVCRDFEKYTNKEFKNSLDDLLPQKLISEVIHQSHIDANKKVNQINKEERKKLVTLLKDFRVTISGFMPLEMAIVTCGGVDVAQVNPKTMESKLVKGVYFAGEILDVDAYTGGYNLQIAFSTAVAAGRSS